MAKQKRKPQIIDGIITTQPRNTRIGEFNSIRHGDFANRHNKPHEAKLTPQKPNLERHGFSQGHELSLSDDDMKELETSTKPTKHYRLRRWKNPKKPKQPWTFKKVMKRTFQFGALGALVVVLFLGVKFFLATQNIIDRAGEGALALQENVDPSQLNGEGDGRVNILLIGIGGEGHEAPNLSDSMIIVSLDPFAHEVSMLSIPRDFYVDIPDYWSSRINAAHSIGEDQEHPGGGVALLEQTLEETLDIPIHYYIRGDFTGLIQAVDAVGGVDVYVEEAVYDTTFNWQYGILDVDPGWQHFDGERALMYSRSRKTSARGDFARSDRQRQILVALKDKVFSLGTFGNPLKISSLLDAGGSHVRTNLQISEMLRLHEIGQQVDSTKIVSAGLSNDVDNYLKSANIGGASVLIPKAGQGDYSEIQRYVRTIFPDGFIKKEGAKIDVLNGSGQAGIAADQTDLLKSYGYNIVWTADAPTQDYTQTVIYDRTDNAKPYTKRLLERRYSANAKPGRDLPGNIHSTADFVIILGSNEAE